MLNYQNDFTQMQWCHLSCDSNTTSIMDQQDDFKGSPYHRHRDVESGGSSRYPDCSEEDNFSPFDLTTTKHAPIERLKRWRVFFFFILGLKILISTNFFVTVALVC